MVPPGPGTYSVGRAQFAGQHIEILPEWPNMSALAIPALPYAPTCQHSPYQPNQGINMAQLGPYQPLIHTHYGQWPQKYDTLGFGSTVKRERVVSLLNSFCR